MSGQDSERRTGLLLGIAAYLVWGVMPLYFKMIASVPATEIVAHRIVWSLFFLAALATFWRRWPAIRAAAGTGRVLLTLMLTAVLIATNWLVYIYAVVSGHVLEGSLGYYLNPLFNVLLGVVLLGERLSRAQIFATRPRRRRGGGARGRRRRRGLWISLTLAFSFGLYGFVRKVAPVDSLEGLSIETALLAPVAAGWLFWLQAAGTAASSRPVSPPTSCWSSAARSPPFPCSCSRRRRGGCLIRRSASSNISRRRCNSCWRCWSSARRSRRRT